jgi:translation initiation factor IF-2
MAKVRVYNLAREFGVESKAVMDQIKEMGVFVRSASSTIEAPVVRRLREAFADQAAGQDRQRERPASAERRLPPVPPSPGFRPGPDAMIQSEAEPKSRTAGSSSVPVAPRPAAPGPGGPRPGTPGGPRPGTPRPAAPGPGGPRPGTPRPAAPGPGGPRPGTPRPAAPGPGGPRPAASQPSAPRPDGVPGSERQLPPLPPSPRSRPVQDARIPSESRPESGIAGGLGAPAEVPVGPGSLHELLRSWDALRKLVPEGEKPARFLADRSGLKVAAIYQLQRIRNQYAHPDEDGWPGQYDLDMATATARELLRRLKDS